MERQCQWCGGIFLKTDLHVRKMPNGKKRLCCHYCPKKEKKEEGSKPKLLGNRYRVLLRIPCVATEDDIIKVDVDKEDLCGIKAHGI